MKAFDTAEMNKPIVQLSETTAYETPKRNIELLSRLSAPLFSFGMFTMICLPVNMAIPIKMSATPSATVT